MNLEFIFMLSGDFFFLGRNSLEVHFIYFDTLIDQNIEIFYRWRLFCKVEYRH